MQTPQAGDKPPRFYHLHIQEDLLEGWTLVKESGYQGSGGKVTREHFEFREDAIDALIRTRDRQVNRGFRIVFAEGVHAI
jgi:predicted DNA-binding WGR domain protein